MRDDLKNLLIRKYDKADEFADSHELYEHLDYDGSVHNIIDSEINIFYYDLRKWAVENYDYIEEAIQNGLTEGCNDFHKLIQFGQYVKLEEDARDIIESFFDQFNGILFNVEYK